MEDSVVNMEDFGGFGEFGSVPVVMGRKNRGFRETIDTEDNISSASWFQEHLHGVFEG